MNNVGLNYLSLNRETSSLSGGEAQRIRLSAQLGSNLSGVLYILDEPSIGLHPKDNKKLIESLRSLQKKGNSLIVVEHDPETISQADLLIDIGPEAGIKGGNITAIGKPSEIKANFNSATIDYLHNGIRHPIRGNWRKLPAKSFSEKTSDWLKVENVNFRNLKNISLTIPTEKLSVCCGVSGSGKSSLIRGFLADAVRKAINENSKKLVLEHGTIHNGHIFNKLIEVTQSPIGKTPRSTPATYLGVWDQIRTMISSLPEAKARGFSPSHFSFNVKGGRCELCKGAGRIKVEMNFLPNSYIICSECEGKRYRKDILNLTWNSKNIFEILELTFEEAAEFFKFDHVLHETFSLMVKTGLGYIKLGQISPTLSGGESQRLKLAAELANGIDKQKYKRFKKSKPNLYILEEPTIGLHTTDCKKLISLLHRLVDEGNSVIVIEHDIDIIAEADFLFELGPKGGMDGGKVTCKGTVKQITSHSKSQTAPFLKKIFH
jgi:excinuclease ABC subunit A